MVVTIAAVLVSRVLGGALSCCAVRDEDLERRETADNDARDTLVDACDNEHKRCLHIDAVSVYYITSRVRLTKYCSMRTCFALMIEKAIIMKQRLNT